MQPEINSSDKTCESFTSSANHAKSLIVIAPM